MNSHRIARFIVLMVALTGIGACRGTHDSDLHAAQTRRLEHFDSLDVAGALRLEVNVGGPHAVRVEGPQSALEEIITEVEGDTLHVRSKHKVWFFTRRGARATLAITMPHLAVLRLEGGHDAHLSGLAGGHTRIETAGAVNLDASGHLEALTVHLAGASHADLSQLSADRVEVTLQGVGSVTVHPKESLDATMNGVGAILYVGRPRHVNTRMNGLGTIGRAAGERDGGNAEAPAIEPQPLQPEPEDATRPASGGTTAVI